MTRKRVALIFGGRSAEHDVSILSARSVVAAASPDRLELIPICIAHDGSFLDPERSADVLAGGASREAGSSSFSFETWVRDHELDAAFPLVHGTGGEDGVLQGYLETLGVPYVGSGVTASAISMDKHAMKQAFVAAKLPVVEYVSVQEIEWQNERERVSRAVVNAMRLPYFVKPANGGSSVGVTKVKKGAELDAAVAFALQFDDKVLVERGLDAREVEVGVLGNERPEASVPGEIVAGREFYDYEDKYVDDKSQLVIPAKLQADRSDEFRRLAVAAFRSVGASGFARVDFFLERGTNRVFVNEINTIPGFTSISMYPKLWEATEVKYGRLIERLIELGIERSRARKSRRDGAMAWLESAKPLT